MKSNESLSDLRATLCARTTVAVRKMTDEHELHVAATKPAIGLSLLTLGSSTGVL